MGDFTPRARTRIKKSVRWTELHQDGGGVGPERPGGLLDGRPRWFELQGNLDAGGTATGHILDWSESADSGAGDYVEDSTNYTLTDTTGQHWGLQYEVILARAVAADDGNVWEVLTSGAGFHKGTIPTAPVSGTSATCSISVAGNTVSVTAISYFGDPTLLDDGGDCGISFDIGVGEWILTQAEC